MNRIEDELGLLRPSGLRRQTKAYSYSFHFLPSPSEPVGLKAGKEPRSFTDLIPIKAQGRGTESDSSSAYWALNRPFSPQEKTIRGVLVAAHISKARGLQPIPPMNRRGGP